MDRREFEELVHTLYRLDGPGVEGFHATDHRVRLAVFLSPLARAELLDLSWPHQVGVSTVDAIVGDCLSRICDKLRKVCFP